MSTTLRKSRFKRDRSREQAVVFEPLDFIARLAALVPRPWVNLTRFHGVFAPNSKYRKAVTGYDKSSVDESSDKTTSSEQRYRMS